MCATGVWTEKGAAVNVCAEGEVRRGMKEREKDAGEGEVREG